MILKWWMLGNGWRKYWKYFRVPGRNRTHNHSKTSQGLQPLSYRNSWWGRSLAWVLLQTKCLDSTWGLKDVTFNQCDNYVKDGMVLNPSMDEWCKSNDGCLVICGDSYLEMFSWILISLHPLPSNHHMHHLSTGAFNAISSFIKDGVSLINVKMCPLPFFFGNFWCTGEV